MKGTDKQSVGILARWKNGLNGQHQIELELFVEQDTGRSLCSAMGYDNDRT